RPRLRQRVLSRNEEAKALPPRRLLIRSRERCDRDPQEPAPGRALRWNPHTCWEKTQLCHPERAFRLISARAVRALNQFRRESNGPAFVYEPGNWSLTMPMMCRSDAKLTRLQR